MSTGEKFRQTPQEDPATVGVFVAFLRLLRGWSQEELADALGLTAGAVSRYETGDVVPDRERLEEMARAVGLPFRLLDRTLLLIASARAAVASRADPASRDLRIAAITYELASALLDLAFVTAETVIAELPDLDLGPWARNGPASELEEDEEDLEL